MPKSFIQSIKYFRSRAIGLNTLLDRIFQSWAYPRLLDTKTVDSVKHERLSNSEYPVLFTSEQLERKSSNILSHCLSILKQLFTSLSVASVQYLPRRSVNIHRWPPSLRCTSLAVGLNTSRNRIFPNQNWEISDNIPQFSKLRALRKKSER